MTICNKLLLNPHEHPSGYSRRLVLAVHSEDLGVFPLTHIDIVAIILYMLVLLEEVGIAQEEV